MTHPFALSPDELAANLEEAVDATFGDLQPQSLVLPLGENFVGYPDFQAAYETLKQETGGFATLTPERIWNALRENALALVVLRAILGLTPPEWAELARSELGSDLTQNAARGLDARVRRDGAFFQERCGETDKQRTDALVSIAVKYISQGAPQNSEGTIHRLEKFDTQAGLQSLRHAAGHHVPYAVHLYERYLGRPHASHRDAVSELVGDMMESAIERRLERQGITFRKTARAESIEGFAQAPDFFVPTETAPAAIIEAKIANDDGTARDKVARILRLVAERDRRERAGESGYEVVACIDGRGFGERRQDMRDLLAATRGKVFTMATLDQLVAHTRLREFLPKPSGE